MTNAMASVRLLDHIILGNPTVFSVDLGGHDCHETRLEAWTGGATARLADMGSNGGLKGMSRGGGRMLSQNLKSGRGRRRPHFASPKYIMNMNIPSDEYLCQTDLNGFA